MVIDMLVHPMLYGEICTPGDEPDGFGFWSREFGMGHMGPMDWDELKSRWTSAMCRRACSCRSM